MPEISVIIPMYKTPKLRLRKCLDSLIYQTFSDFEVLVIDDGNEPGYEYIQEEYEKADSRISFIRQEHSGVSNARNLGLKIAKGKFISFVDSDDYVDRSFLSDLYEAIQKDDVAICAISEQYYPVYPGRTDCRIFWSKPSYYNGLQYINFCHNKMYRMELIKKYDIKFQPGMKLGEDAVFLADYLEKCKNFAKVREPRYHYVPEENSAMCKYCEEFWTWEQQVIERQWELFHKYPLSTFEEQAMEHWLYAKINFTLSYYMEREKNKETRNRKMQEIFNSEQFSKLVHADLKKHRHLDKKEQLSIRCWKMFGIHGVSLIAFAKRVRRRLIRR